MPVESAADRAAMMSVTEFGVIATYTTRAGTVVPGVAGILNDPHLAIDFPNGPATSDSQPTFLCLAADLPADAIGGDDGDVIEVEDDAGNGTRYRVADLQPDGTGFMLLTLAAI